MNIAICDDSNEHINLLESYLMKLGVPHTEYDVFYNGEQLVEVYKEHSANYDVLFLDIEMEKLNGIETANTIREFDEHVIIIFITSHSKYMKESFKCLPFRFIEKPIELEELKSAYEDVCKKLSRKRKVFAFSENKRKVRLYCNDIIYCESQDHWTWIHTKDDTYKIYKSMNDVHEHLDKEMLFRVHKSFVVNFHYIKSIKETNIELYHCDKKIPISRSYKKSTLEEYTDFVERNLFV